MSSSVFIHNPVPEAPHVLESGHFVVRARAGEVDLKLFFEDQEAWDDFVEKINSMHAHPRLRKLMRREPSPFTEQA